MKAPADQNWFVDDPETTAPTAPSTIDRDLAAGKKHRPQRHDRRRIGTTEKLFLAMVAGGGVILMVDPSAEPFTLVVLTFLFAVAIICLLELIGFARHVRRVRAFQRGVEAAQARIEAWDQWQDTHRISRNDFPLTGPARDTRALAGAVATAAIAVRNTRAWREGWVGGEWDAVLDRQVWSLLDRLHTSVPVRIALASATERPTLAEAVADATQELADLDAEACALRTQLEDVADLAHEIDRGLAAREAAEAQARRDAELLAQLKGSAPSTIAAADQQLRQLRDQTLNAAAETDLRILAAQLTNLAHSLRTPNTTTTTTGELA